MSEEKVDLKPVDGAYEAPRQFNDHELTGIDFSQSPAIQFHQKIRNDDNQERYSNSFNFDSPALDKSNQIELPSLQMRPENLTVQFKMSAATASGSDPVGYLPVFSWIGQNGIQLLYKGTAIYTCTQAELQSSFYLDNNPSNLHRQQYITNDVASPPSDANSALTNYYLRLTPLMKIFANIGPLSAYDANAWSIIVDLKPASGIVFRVSGSTDTGAGSASVESMSLIVTGHRVSPQVAMDVRQRINTDGIQVNYLQSNFKRASLGSSDTSLNVSLPTLEGRASGMVLIVRTQAYVQGATVDALAGTQYVSMDAYDDLIQVGTQGNPTAVFGRQLPIKTIKMGINTQSQWEGSPVFLDLDGDDRNLSIVPISFADTHSTDSAKGTGTGSLYLKNDLIYELNFGTTPGVAAFVDCITYIQRYCLIRSDGVSRNNLS